MDNTPITLVILDGWGVSEQKDGNAIAQADLPTINHFLKEYPNCILHTSGKAVGLPEGVMGNSEVGHENIGGGRTVTQKLTLISQTMQNGSFFKNKVLCEAIENVKKRNSKLHFMGLISEGDVHSHLGHLYGLCKLAKKHDVEKVILHAITDGRDDPPKAAMPLLNKVVEKLAICNGKIATVCGRYYAMDRDNRWQRVEEYYNLVTQGTGIKSSDPIKAIEDAYNRAGKHEYGSDSPQETSDEFILPTLIGDKKDLIADNDSVIFFNFRPDRAREISTALTQNNFNGFTRKQIPKNLYYTCLTEYDLSLHDETASPKLPIAFTNNDLAEVNRKNSLGEVIANLKLKQIRIAETEKYRHVTSFFNMGRQSEFEGEERVLVPSPKVRTYDLKPEMSASEVADKTVEAIKSGKYSLIVVNFANADMVGHTGIVSAAVKAVEAVDAALKKISDAIKQASGTLLITADHGNAEQLLNEDGSIRTAHSLKPVPFILVNQKLKNAKLQNEGTLADIAPSILNIAGIKQPSEMTGRSLLIEKSAQIL